MTYTLQIDNAAYRLFRKLPKEVQSKIIEEADILRTNPMAGKPLKGKHKSLRSLPFSFKGSAYRIIYQFFQKSSTIMVRLAGTRENIYRRLEEINV